jgi:uncharacterized protein
MHEGLQHLDLFVTEQCNLACAYCFAAGDSRPNPSEAHCQAALDWLVSQGPRSVHVTLWGGEPLIRLPLLRRLVRYGREKADALGKRITWSMPTNGTLLDGSTLNWLRKEKISIFLSLDGEAAAQAGRPLSSGQSSHGLAQRGLRRTLKAVGPEGTRVRLTVTPANVTSLERNVAYFWDQGVGELLVYPALDQPWSDEALQLFQKAQERLADLLVARLCGGAALPPPQLKPWQGLLARLAQGTPRNRKVLRDCGAGRRLVALGVDGHLYPCHRFVFYARQHMARQDLRLGRPGQSMRSLPDLVDLTLADLRGDLPCLDCPCFDLCSFGCSAINYHTTGAFHLIAPWVCTMMRAQAKACQRVHRVLAQHPAYILYVHESARRRLTQLSRELGHRAWRRYDQLSQGEHHSVET